MPLNGPKRRELVDRMLAYMEGRTGDGSALQRSTDQRLYLTPLAEDANGDWAPSGDAAIPFTFAGRGHAWEVEDHGDTRIEEISVITRTELAQEGAYAYDGHEWTIASAGSIASASPSHAFTYVLHRHVE